MGRDRHARQSLGALHTQVKQARVLLIGAGGIGCELLKNLVMTGFEDIHVVDLDTIDLSNLNRQFLFRQEHIKKPKATVAAEVASKFNPSSQLTAHYANIKDTHAFPVSFFRSFAIVFNALDNVGARRHVNKMCLVADVPLIESGTTGFNGQVQSIKKGKTSCYDCAEKAVPKTYPVCTIRSTPTQPIHCIVWAKSYLFPELFGKSEEDGEEGGEVSDVSDQTEDADNNEEIQTLKAEAQALKRIRETMHRSDFVKQVFEKVFKDDIERLRGMKDMWKMRRPPTSLDFSTLQSEASPNPPVSTIDQNPWTLHENFSVFVSSLQRLATRLQRNLAAAATAAGVSNISKTKPIIEFDKDDPDALDFITSASNLRSNIFSISPQSRFNIKQMAGNIIPAIATTNAMTAGLCVMQAFKILRGDYFRAKMVFLESNGVRAINSEPPRPPNPECAVCSVAMAGVDMDPQRATLSDLVVGVLKSDLGYSEEMTIMNEIGPIYDADMEDMLNKKFTEIGVRDESFLTVIDDEEDNPRVNLQLTVASRQMADGERPVMLVASDNETAQSKITDKSERRQQGGAAKLDISRKPIHASVATGPNKVKRTAEEAGLEDLDTLKENAGPEITVGAEAVSGALKGNFLPRTLANHDVAVTEDAKDSGRSGYEVALVGPGPEQATVPNDSTRNKSLDPAGAIDDGSIWIEDD